ncbi:MAG: acetyltransferase, partial [Myxococcota bacterium]
RAIIFGHGGHAAVLRGFIQSRYAGSIEYAVDEPGQPDELAIAAILAEPERFADRDLYLGVGNNRVRRRWFEQLDQVGLTPATLIAPHTYIADDAEIAAGAQICVGAVINARARIGRNVIINTMASVDHDCVIGDHAQLTPGVILGGVTHIGESCYFGVRSCTIHCVTIGARSFAMAGAVIAKDVPEGVVVGGCPARVIRPVGADEL